MDNSDVETLYIFHDKTARCFPNFALIDDYTRLVAVKYLLAQEPLSVGDMLAFRDDLVSAGYKWGTDFYVTKYVPPKKKKLIKKKKIKRRKTKRA